MPVHSPDGLTPTDAFRLESGGREDKPQRHGAPDNLSFRHNAEIAAIEAVGVWGEQEQVTCAQLAATPPRRHRAPAPIADACAGDQTTADEYAIGKAADAVATDGSDDLDQIRGFRQIPTPCASSATSGGGRTSTRSRRSMGPASTRYSPTGTLADAFQINSGRLGLSEDAARIMPTSVMSRTCRALNAFGRMTTSGGLDHTTL